MPKLLACTVCTACITASGRDPDAGVLDALTPGVWVNQRLWRRSPPASGSRLIKTGKKKKTWTCPAAPVSISHMPRTPPFGRAARAKAVPLRAAAQPVWPFEVLCLANRPRRRPARLPWLGFTGRRQTGEETHSTLINTWPHYLSHEAESREGEM